LASLTIDRLTVRYGHVTALRDVSVSVGHGTITAILGANGAGKSTLLAAVMGMVMPAGGHIRVDQAEITRLRPAATWRAGVCLVPEGRALFPSLKVDEHFVVGLGVSRRAAERRERVDAVYELFPELRGREQDWAVMLSGGQQQMVAIGRALVSRPKILMLDEPSFGLAPKLVDRVLDVVESLRAAGTTIVLVEQNARAALEIADTAYVLHNGAVQAEGSAEELANDAAVQRAYFGG
jgi:branched-chain amino acid transport system ATP-binding protein